MADAAEASASRRVDIGEGGIERAVPKVLANHEGIGPLLNHQHGRRVFQDMGVLERLTESGLVRDGFEQLVDGHSVQLCGLLAVEHVVVRVRFPNVKPSLERRRLR